jgi:hypothetical protein
MELNLATSKSTTVDPLVIGLAVGIPAGIFFCGVTIFTIFCCNFIYNLKRNVQNGTVLQQNNNPPSETVNPTSSNQNDVPPFSSNWYRYTVKIMVNLLSRDSFTL